MSPALILVVFSGSCRCARADQRPSGCAAATMVHYESSRGLSSWSGRFLMAIRRGFRSSSRAVPAGIAQETGGWVVDCFAQLTFRFQSANSTPVTIASYRAAAAAA